jgi:hypothetical protein
LKEAAPFVEKKRLEEFGGCASWGKKAVGNFAELKANLLREERPLKIDYVHIYNNPWKQYFRNSVLSNNVKLRAGEVPSVLAPSVFSCWRNLLRWPPVCSATVSIFYLLHLLFPRTPCLQKRTHFEADSHLSRSKHLAREFSSGRCSAGPLHMEASVRAAAKSFGSIREFLAAIVHELSDLICGDRPPIYVCGSIPKTVVGKVSETLVNSIRPLVRYYKRGPICHDADAGIALLDNLLGGLIPQNYQSKFLRKLTKVCRATGALHITSLRALGALPVDRVFPSVILLLQCAMFRDLVYSVV